MKITGSYTLDAPRDEVWEALNNIEVLARVVPGCERLDQVGENEFEGTVKIGIQSIKGTYQGKIRLEDIQPPHHYKLVASGKSANGVVDGAGTVDLEEKDGKTLLKYGGDAQIGGILASVGQRLIEGASRQLINQSLKALAEQIVQRRQPAPEAAEATPAAPAPEPGPGATSPEPPQAAEPPAAANGAASDAASSSAVAAPVEAAARRTVVVPESEQLKPESIMTGMVSDLYKERPWIIWVALAFVIGYLFGRSR